MTFLTVSAVIGAGFLSGREIVAFFGTESFLPFLVISFFITAAFFGICYYSGAKESSLSALNSRLFFFPKTLNIAVLFASFISAAGSLAAINSLFGQVFTRVKFPFFSVIILFFASLVSEKGIKGVEKISLILTPLIIVIVLSLIAVKSETDFSVGKINYISGGVKTFLYACMNCFINLPALVDGARGKSGAAHKTSAVLSALIISSLAVLIAAAIKGERTENFDAPLLFAVGKSPLFFIALFFALLTSLFSAYYPLYSFAKERGKTAGKIALAVATFALSLIGVKGIIDGIYPVIGAIGAVYMVKCARFAFYSRYKKNLPEHNKEKRREKMKKKRKNKVAKLSEEDYNKYIMALKDEKPPVAVRKAQKED